MAAVEPLLEAVLVDRDPTGPERREPGGAGLDEMDPVAEPGEPDGADETDIAGADDGERTFRGRHRGRAYQSSADVGPPGRCDREDRIGGQRRRDRVGCARARHAVPDRGARTPVHARRRRGGRCRGRRSIRVATSTSTRRRAGGRSSDHARRRDAPAQRLRVRVAGSWRRSSGRRTSSAPGPASPTSTARPATATAFDVGAVRFATLDTPGPHARSTSATRSPTRPAATSRSCS